MHFTFCNGICFVTLYIMWRLCFENFTFWNSYVVCSYVLWHYVMWCLRYIALRYVATSFEYSLSEGMAKWPWRQFIMWWWNKPILVMSKWVFCWHLFTIDTLLRFIILQTTKWNKKLLCMADGITSLLLFSMNIILQIMVNLTVHGRT